MNGRLLAQLAHLFWAEAEATPIEDERERVRLETTSKAIAYRARCAGQTDMGTDEVFGGDSKEEASS